MIEIFDPLLQKDIDIYTLALMGSGICKYCLF